MKILLPLLALGFVSAALASNIPFTPEMEARLSAIESGFPSDAYAIDGLLTHRIARVTYDVAEHGGSSTAHLLGVTLPAGAVIERDWFYTNTQFTDSGSGTVALSCAAANDIYSAADITGNAAGVLVEGVSTGATSLMKPITTACEVTATVGTVPQLTGKLTLFIQYVVR